MTYDASAGSTRTVTAFFDSRRDAEEAIEDLVAAGYSRQSIRLLPGGEGGTAGATSYQSTGSHNEHKGFWDSLADLFLPDDDRHTYAEGLRRGGHMVSVTTSDANYDRALDILDREGTIDLDERESAWRSEGWARDAGYESGSATGGGYAGGTATGGTYAKSESGVRSGEEVIPVTEENLRVGKREVSHGRVRVRSYVVETPVNEQVNLREEHVRVERRPVDRPLTGDERLFQDRTIEVEETAEEAVVTKDARVREELVVGKDVTERSETVSDTVRRTEVDIEDERGNRIGGTTGRGSDYDRRR